MRLIVEDPDIELIGKFARLFRAEPRRKTKTPARRLSDIHTILMTTTAYEAAMEHLTWAGREEAGLLIGPAGHHCVTHFVPDLMGEGTPGMFTISARTLNETLKKFVALKSEAAGFIHAHPPGCRALSPGDMRYVRKILSNPKNVTDRLLMPIVVDGRMIPFIIFADDPETVHEGRIQLF